MTDLLKLIVGVLASLFRSRAKLEAENLVLRQQINVLCRRMPKRPDLNNTDCFLFVWLYHWFPCVLGAVTAASASVRANRLSVATRATDIALQQGINMRRRVLRGLQQSGQRKIAYWGITDSVDRYGVDNSLNFSLQETCRAASVPTRLTRVSTEIRACILRAGYAHADAALRGSEIILPNMKVAVTQEAKQP